LPVLLVVGGSQGAHSINRAVSDGLVPLLSAAHIVHITGRRDVEWIRAQRSALPEELQIRYHVYDYLDAEMVDALVASDLAVARAGASTLGELPAAGLPGVLVPYPYAGAHQWANARLLADAGAAVIVPDAELPAALVPRVSDLLADTQRRTAMGQASRALARPEAAAAIGGWLHRLAAADQRGSDHERAKN
jgi:UDP-N-acetylglucosamine--N-acetylmuramyl-(pentapeptide) pyrophosphoryl-undecaprenol N-acetylglucosamine transferase